MFVELCQEKTANISQHNHWFFHKMTSKHKQYKFHTVGASDPKLRHVCICNNACLSAMYCLMYNNIPDYYKREATRSYAHRIEKINVNKLHSQNYGRKLSDCVVILQPRKIPVGVVSILHAEKTVF